MLGGITAQQIEAWATVAAVLVAVVAFVWGLRQLGEMSAARRGQVMADIARRWDSDEFIDARVLIGEHETPEALRDEVARARNTDRRKFYCFLREPNFYEDLALLLDAKAIELPTISQWIGRAVISRWDQWRLAVEWMRVQPDLGRDEYRAWECLAWAVGVYRATSIE
jgi:hypothetical protein